MQWDVVTDNIPDILHAVWLTVYLTVITMVVSTIIAIPLGILRNRGDRLAKVIFVFSWVMRSIPGLVMLFLVFYGLPAVGILVPVMPTALIGFIVMATGYNLEIMYGSIQSIDRRQFDTVRALGIGPMRAWISVLIPQAIRAAIPPYFTNATNVLKGTSVASIITVKELTAQTNILIGETLNVVPLLILSAVVYLLLASLLTGAQAVLERRLT